MLPSKNVVIIGAGPAGLEAARVAALTGHHVEIYEKTNMIGGQLSVAATPKFKDQLKKLVKWFEVQLNKLDVTIHFNYEVKPDDQILKNADQIIVACGADEIVPNIKGINNENVISVIDAHMHKDMIKGENVIMCGGGLSGIDSAIELASEHGKNVTIIEMADSIAKDVLFINQASIFAKIDEYKINVITGAKVIEFNNDGIVYQKDGQEIACKAETIIRAFGMKPNRKLAEEIRSAYPTKTRIVGDSEKIGKVANAIRDGFYAAMSL